jgi:hypothetical protein
LGGFAEPTEPDMGPLSPRRPVPTEPEAKVSSTEANRNGVDDLGRVRVPEPVSGSQATTARTLETGSGRTLVGDETIELETDADIRFAPQGHHPAETTTGLLSKLRRQPKLPSDHMHKFKESGSSVGLVRRVCIECAYVSIGSDGE